MKNTSRSAVIAGVGPGLGSALCRAFSKEGYIVAGLRRHSGPFSPPVKALGNTLDSVVPLSVDLTDEGQVEAAFTQIKRQMPPLRLAVYNVAKFHGGAFAQTDAAAFEACWRAGAYGAVLFAKAALPLMLEAGGGCLMFTGATASIRGGNGFSAFASAKFALRGLAQSLAREYGPKGIHVAHVIVDGRIDKPVARAVDRTQEGPAIAPDELAALYLDLSRQKKNAWTQELDVRPAMERW
jgi:NAD(P)-dependent dehydrogenase (short-subunit alcohol dehydrogenase family)